MEVLYFIACVISGLVLFILIYISDEINQIKKELDARKIDHFIAYIRQHKIPLQEPGFPTDEQTKRWMENHGIRPCDQEALIYKYLAKALKSDA